MELWERLELICRREGLSVAALERISGAGRGNLTRVISEKKDSIQLPWLCSLARQFPQYDLRWLVMGEGEPECHVSTVVAADVPQGRQVMQPHYAVDFLAGFREGFSGENVSPDEFICFPAFRTADLWVDITGRAMEPFLCHGDIVAVRRLEDWKENILFGEAYIVVTSQNRMIRRIRSSHDPSRFVLVADNECYDSQEVAVSQVKEVYKILAAVRKVF